MFWSAAEVHEATTLDQASELLARFGSQAQLMMGGTDLLIDIQTGRARPSHIVSLNRVTSLGGITAVDDGVRIGAAATISQLEMSDIIRERFPAILDPVREMGSPQIRNMSTVGGNIAGAVPSADLPPILMVMNARVTLWSRSGQRVLPLEALFTGPRQTARRDDEVLTEIVIPFPPARFGAAYMRFSLRKTNALAVAAVAAGLVFGEDGKIQKARIGLCAVAPTSKLVEVTPLLEGQVLDEASISRAAAAAVEACQTRSSIRGQAEFRHSLVDALTRRALATAGQRAQAESGARHP